MGKAPIVPADNSVVDAAVANLEHSESSFTAPSMAAPNIEDSIMSESGMGEVAAPESDQCFCEGSEQLRKTCLVMVSVIRHTTMKVKAKKRILKMVTEELHENGGSVQ